MTLADTVVRDTALDRYGANGIGIVVQDGATLDTEGCEVTGNRTAGIAAHETGTTVSLVDTTVRDTLLDESEKYGVGILVCDGAALSVEACSFSRNMAAGIVAHDSGTRVSLEGVLVEETRSNGLAEDGFGVDVYDGVELWASGCEIAGNACEGLVVSGRGTEVTIVDSSVRDTRPNGNGEDGFGIAVQEGAKLSAERCEVVGNTLSGILVVDPGTEVTLEDIVVRDTNPSEDGEGGHGIQAANGALLRAEGCGLVENRSVGLAAMGVGTQVALRGSTVWDTFPDPNGVNGIGIGVNGGATLTADGCEIVGNTLAGVGVEDQGTEVMLVACSVRSTLLDGDGEGGWGACVQLGASLSAEQCELSDNAYIGLAAYSGATLTARDCLVSGNTIEGIMAAGAGTRAALVDTVVRDTLPSLDGRFGYGIEIQAGAILRAQGCEVVGNTAVGLLATDAATQVAIRDSIISGTTSGMGEKGMVALGLAAQQGAVIVGSGLVIEDNGGPGLYSVGQATRLACANCSLHGNRFAGAATLREGTLEIEYSEISDTLESADLGGGVGIYAAEQGDFEPPSLIVRDSDLQDNQVAGAWLGGAGSYVLSGNRIAGTEASPHGATTRCGDGVYAIGTDAWTGASGLLLSGNTLANNQGGGLFLDDAHVQLEGNSWTGNDPDLWIQGDACLSPHEDWAEAPTSEICPVWDRPACEMEFSLVMQTSDIEPARSRLPAIGIHFPQFRPSVSPAPPPSLPTPAPRW